MKKEYKDYLFEKHILVSERSEQYVFETLFAMADLFGVRITSGEKLANSDMISYLSEMFGVDVPKPFYTGFPASVRELTSDQLLFDQLVHYAVTYGFGNFENPGHSLFETEQARPVFKEDTQIRDFIIVTEEEAYKRLRESVEALCAGSRPLNNREFTVVSTYCNDHGYVPEKIASKNTAVRLLIKTGNTEFSRFLQLSDVIRLADELNYEKYDNENIRKLNLKNHDRKLIKKVLDLLFERGKCNITECYEKKALWNGLLHHIHYKAVNEEAQLFLNNIRGNRNYSDYSEFEKAISGHNVRKAADILKEKKGNGALIRHLVHLLRAASDDEDIDYILNSVDPGNFIILLQLYMKYASEYTIPGKVSYSFVKHGKMRYHRAEHENAKRLDHYQKKDGDTGNFRLISFREKLAGRLGELIKQTLKNRLGKVYVDPAMRKMALPLAADATSGGFGVLATGSRVKLEDSKKIRAFIYWEKVDDIDLSVLGINDSFEMREFSWRTMSERQSEAITFSGDETSGYKDGSEYFDIIPELFKKQYPDTRYLIFTANVYSYGTFADTVCRAGYMKRDIEDSGEIFEPKTVATSFKIDCRSRFGYLFALDLAGNELIWLNLAQGADMIIAAQGECYSMMRYLETVDIYNLSTFFKAAATEVVSDPAKADVIVSDTANEADIKEGQTIIRSYDFDRIKALMNRAI